MVGTGDVEDEGDAISEGNHSAVRPLVRSVPTELPQPGRNDARYDEAEVVACYAGVDLRAGG